MWKWMWSIKNKIAADKMHMHTEQVSKNAYVHFRLESNMTSLQVGFRKNFE